MSERPPPRSSESCGQRQRFPPRSAEDRKEEEEDSNDDTDPMCEDVGGGTGDVDGEEKEENVAHE